MLLSHRPVPGAPNQGFGENPTRNNPHPVYGNYQEEGHLATDFPCPAGTPVAAAGPGLVVYAGWGQDMPKPTADKYGYIFGSAGWASGLIVILDHGDGSATAYSHLSALLTTAGRQVAGGETLALSGKTGRSTGPHLHLEYMTLPIDYGSPYYSRSDPMKQYGIEEDDMFTNEDRKLLADVAQRISITNTSVQDGTKKVRGDLATVHNTIIRDVGAQLGSIQAGVSESVDVDSLALELAGQLETRDLEALVKRLAVTVKEV